MHSNHARRIVLRSGLTVLACGFLANTALAQSNISTTDKFSWQENCGWMNWRDAGPEGARISATFLSGFVWAENVGWINLGDGTPGSGSAYANASGADAGVNILPGGDLAGMAWGENVGWINFGTAPFVPATQRARFDAAARRFRGFAWGENIGWVNLDDAVRYVAQACYANCDASTIAPILNVNDFACFLNRFSSGDPTANCDGSTVAPILNVNDFACFLNQFSIGCS